MTGRRPPRGGPGDPWRGGRPVERGREPGSDPGNAAHGRHAELEELSVAAVGRPAGARVGLGAVAGIVAVAALLAGGFGLLGGRPDPSASPGSTTAAVAPSAPPPSPVAPPPTPLVTPYAPCAGDPGETPPEISLQTNGVPTLGLTEVLDRDNPEPPSPSPTPADPLEALQGPRVVIEPDVVTEVWIEGGACALRWFVGLYDPVSGEGEQLAEVPIDGPLDPRVAAQNRFALWHRLPAHRDSANDVQLFAALEFEEIVVIAWWRVRIQPIRIPEVTLRNLDDGDEIPLVPGCDLMLRLANGYTEPVLGCQGDLSAPLGTATRIHVDDPLLLEFDGVGAVDVIAVCGQQSGSAFMSDAEPSCFLEPPDGEPLHVTAPPGTWVLAISTCAAVDTPSSTAFNALCGTWYARVLVDEGDD